MYICFIDYEFYRWVNAYTTFRCIAFKREYGVIKLNRRSILAFPLLCFCLYLNLLRLSSRYIFDTECTLEVTNSKSDLVRVCYSGCYIIRLNAVFPGRHILGYRNQYTILGRAVCHYRIRLFVRQNNIIVISVRAYREIPGIQFSWRIGNPSSIDRFNIEYKLFPVCIRNVTCRTKGINAGSISTLTVATFHRLYVHPWFQIDRITELALTEMNDMVGYPPFTFPCLSHQGKGIDKIGIVIGNKFGWLRNNAIVYFKFKRCTPIVIS